MKTLTRSVQRHITDDWHSRFPSLSVYKPMWLMRRVGPMLVGICLNRDSGNEIYKPIAHVDCLCSPAFDDGVPITRDYIALTLDHQPLKPLWNGRQGLMYVRVPEHSTKWQEQADLLEKQAYVPLEGPLRIDQVLDGYNRFLNRPNDAMYYPYCYADMVLLLAWAGRSSDASEMIAAACDEMAIWPPAALERFGGLAGWRHHITEAANDPEGLRETVEMQVHKLGLNHVTAEQFD